MNADAATDGHTTVSLSYHLGSVQFWFKSLQDWQSESLSTAVLVVLSIFLRLKESLESNQWRAPHSEAAILLSCLRASM
ncbi:DUF6766 family protein [Rhizobium sp. CG4]|uniref:DUF6766 family protein n=1 Tax=Rhizobium sp. CG4 TaxID=2726075 RepID=UPI00333170E8